MKPTFPVHGTLAAISNVADSEIAANAKRLNLLINNTSAVAIYVQMGLAAPTAVLNDAVLLPGARWQTALPGICYVRASDGSAPTVPYREDF